MSTTTAYEGQTSSAHTGFSGATRGGITVLLRLEAAAGLLLSIAAYRAMGGGWAMFALLILAPDLSMLGYLLNRRFGAAAYNFGHSYLSAAALAGLGWSLHQPMLEQAALIWAAHISVDRLVGYGLKYPQAFGATHLGWVGKRRA
ncbi:MAG TPA: DUF4260 domain-containing protein [Phenylobacterium sp.]|jgi:hypothetical protein|nr:DUF4260 domain-containing protein [Phenylobacterium sp.]